MDSVRKGQDGRPRPGARGRPAIPAARIVAAAVALVDAEGAAALSMRTLAQRLDSGTTTLYRHFANRSQLVGAVVDSVFGEIDLDVVGLANQEWQRSCEEIASTMFTTLGRHPGIAHLLLEQMPLGINSMMLREKSLAMFLANGFTPELAARAHATLSRYVLGFAIQLSTESDSDSAQIADAFRSVDKSMFPATLTAAVAMPVPLQDEFDFGLKLIVQGLSRIKQ